MLFNQFFMYILLPGLLFLGGCATHESDIPEEKESPVGVQKVSSINALPGKNSVKVTWTIPENAGIKKIRVYWNGEQDWVDLPVTAGTVNMETVINDLEEGNYLFSVYAYDKDDNASPKVFTNGRAYGNEYENSLVNRPIQNLEFKEETSTVIIDWANAETGIVGLEMEYTDADEVAQSLEVEPFSATTTLNNFVSGKKFAYRTLYKPTPTAIDIFYTEYDTITVENSDSGDLLTAGWTEVDYEYSIHTPWNLPQSDRYSYSNGEHHFWVYKDDACHYNGCGTGPRSELRMKNDYLTGRHQFEGDVYIVEGSEGTTVMQVFGGVEHSTSLMLKVHPGNNGTLKRYDNETLLTNVFGKWIHVNVQHEAINGIGKIYVYLNNELKGVFDDRGYKTHYFKCGTYNITDGKTEVLWKNIKYWKDGPI